MKPYALQGFAEQWQWHYYSKVEKGEEVAVSQMF